MRLTCTEYYTIIPHVQYTVHKGKLKVCFSKILRIMYRILDKERSKRGIEHQRMVNRLQSKNR